MRSAKAFLVGMYAHLLLSIAVPIGIFLLGQGSGWNAAAVGLLVFYLLAIVTVQILGWVTVGMASTAYRQGKIRELRDGWKRLKFHSIPFYILNFFYSYFIWFILVGASRGILILLVPIPIFITCLMIVQSGCLGVFYIKYLRKQPENENYSHSIHGIHENGNHLYGIHYVLQLLPVLDVVSTIAISKKYAQEIHDQENKNPPAL